MGSKPFHFKQFTVEQNLCTHKVGTDGVLLGAWAKIRPQDTNIVDVGTGSGVIALMLAQRSSSKAHIDAVEQDFLSMQQAADNVSRSPWPDKVTVHHLPVQQFLPKKQYDLMVSNPPYFINSLRPPDQRRSQARHAHSLSFEDLLQNATRLLRKNGRLALILPYTEAMRFLELARGYRLLPTRKTTFRARAKKPVERILLELAFKEGSVSESEIVLYEQGGSWSAGYKELTHAFYLNA